MHKALKAFPEMYADHTVLLSKSTEETIGAKN
jgi:hypothetical protein